MFRTNVSTKTSPSTRTGLGLHIVSSIVRKYQGRVVAANRERGNGAVFTISLPPA
jgi:signal transduction histidine kinase